MAVTFVTSAVATGNPTTSFSITLPATQAGDILTLEYTHRGTTDATIGGTYTGPAFTEKHDQQYAAATFSGKTLWSRATGNHSGETVTGSSLTNSCAAGVSVYRGALASGDPLADATIVGEANASANETQAQITTATDGAWVVLVVANSPDVAVTAQTCTSPGALTTRMEKLSTGGLDTSINHASAEKATAGATGSFTWSQTDGPSGSWAYAIKPAAAVTHAATGALSGAGATVAGTASSATTRAASGAITGAGATLAGTAARTREHATTGILAGAGSLVVGAADRQDGGEPITHDATGALIAQGSTISGSASSATTRTSSGALIGAGAIVVGSAARVGAPVSHASSGALVGGGSIIVGAAGRPADTSQAGFDIPRMGVFHQASGHLVARGAMLRGTARVTRTGQNTLALLLTAG